jgi:hypothetical protein
MEKVMKRFLYVIFTVALIMAVISAGLLMTACLIEGKPASTTPGKIIKNHLEIVTQGKTYRPIEHFVYSLQDGVCADGKWFDKTAADMDPALKENLAAAEAIPYANDFTFLRVWSGGSEKIATMHVHVFDDQLEQISDCEGFEVPSDDGLYYVAALIHTGNEKAYVGYQYIFKVVRDAAPMTGDPLSDGKIWNPAAARAELKKLPQNYQPEQAMEDGCLVILHGKLLSDPQIAAGFIAAARAGKAASLRIVQYTVEGDPIIMQVDYQDGIYHGLLDESRDHFGRFGSEIIESDMPYLAVFDDEERQVA